MKGCSFSNNNFFLDTDNFKINKILEQINASPEILSVEHIEKLSNEREPIFDNNVNVIDRLYDKFEKFGINILNDEKALSQKDTINISKDYNKKISEVLSKEKIKHFKSLFGPITTPNITLFKNIEDFTVSELLLLFQYVNEIDISIHDYPIRTLYNSARISAYTRIMYLHDGNPDILQVFAEKKNNHISGIAYRQIPQTFINKIIDVYYNENIIIVDDENINIYDKNIVEELKTRGYYVDDENIYLYKNIEEIKDINVKSDKAKFLNSYNYKHMLYTITNNISDEEAELLNHISMDIYDTPYPMLKLGQQLIINQIYLGILLHNPSLNIFNYQRIINEAIISNIDNINSLYNILHITSIYNDLSFLKEINNNLYEDILSIIESNEQSIVNIFTNPIVSKKPLFFDSYNGYYLYSVDSFYKNAKSYNPKYKSYFDNSLGNQVFHKALDYLFDKKNVSERLLGFILSLLERSDIKFDLLNKQEFISLMRFFGKEYNGEKIFYRNGCIYICDDINDETDILHELLHPFILIYFKIHNESFENIFKLIIEDTEYYDIYLKSLDYYNDENLAKQETVVLFLTKYFNNEYSEKDKSFFKRILDEILDFIKMLLGLPKKYNLSKNSQLKDLIKFINEENIVSRISEINDDVLYQNINYLTQQSQDSKDLIDLMKIKNELEIKIQKNLKDLDFLNTQNNPEIVKDLLNDYENIIEGFFLDVKSFLSGKVLTNISEILLNDLSSPENYDFVSFILSLLNNRPKQENFLTSIINEPYIKQIIQNQNISVEEFFFRESLNLYLNNLVSSISIINSLLKIINNIYISNSQVLERIRIKNESISLHDSSKIESVIAIVLMIRNLDKYISKIEEFLQKYIINNLLQSEKENIFNLTNKILKNLKDYNDNLQKNTENLLVDFTTEYFWMYYNVTASDTINYINEVLSSIQKNNNLILLDNLRENTNFLQNLLENIKNFVEDFKDIKTTLVSGLNKKEFLEFYSILKYITDNVNPLTDKSILNKFTTYLRRLIASGFVLDKEIMKAIVLGSDLSNIDVLRSSLSAIDNNNFILSGLASILNLGNRAVGNKTINDFNEFVKVVNKLKKFSFGANSNISPILTLQTYYFLKRGKHLFEESKTKNYAFIIPQNNYSNRYVYLISKRNALVENIIGLTKDLYMAAASKNQNKMKLINTSLDEIQKELKEVEEELKLFYSKNVEHYEKYKEQVLDDLELKYKNIIPNIKEDVKLMLAKFQYLTFKIRSVEQAIGLAIKDNIEQKELKTLYDSLLKERKDLFYSVGEDIEAIKRKAFTEYFEKISLSVNTFVEQMSLFEDDLEASLLANGFKNNGSISDFALLIDILSSKTRLHYKRDGSTGEVIHFAEIQKRYDEVYSILLRNNVSQKDIDILKKLSEKILLTQKEIFSLNALDDMYDDIFIDYNNIPPITQPEIRKRINRLNKLSKLISSYLYKLLQNVKNPDDKLRIDQLYEELTFEKKLRPQIYKQLLEILIHNQSTHEGTNNFNIIKNINNNVLAYIPEIKSLVGISNIFIDETTKDFKLPKIGSVYHLMILDTLYRFKINAGSSKNSRIVEISYAVKSSKDEYMWTAPFKLSFNKRFFDSLKDLSYVYEKVQSDIEVAYEKVNYHRVKVSSFATYSIPDEKEAYSIDTSKLTRMPKIVKDVIKELFDGYYVGNKYIRSLFKLEFITPEIVGLTVDNRGNYLPKIFKEDIFIDIAIHFQTYLLSLHQDSKKAVHFLSYNITNLDTAYIFLNQFNNEMPHNFFYELVRTRKIDLNKYLIRNSNTEKFIDNRFFEIYNNDIELFDDLLTLLSWWINYQEKNLKTYIRLFAEIPRFTVNVRELRKPKDYREKILGLTMNFFGIRPDDETWESVVNKEGRTMYDFGLASLPLYGNQKENYVMVSTSLASFIRYFENVARNNQLNKTFPLVLSVSYIRDFKNMIPVSINKDNIEKTNLISFLEFNKKTYDNHLIEYFILQHYRGRRYFFIGDLNLTIVNTIIRNIKSILRFVAFYASTLDDLAKVVANFIAQHMTYKTYALGEYTSSRYSIESFLGNSIKLKNSKNILTIELFGRRNLKLDQIAKEELAYILLFNLHPEIISKIFTRHINFSNINFLALISVPYKPKWLAELYTSIASFVNEIVNATIEVDIIQGKNVVRKKINLLELYSIDKNYKIKNKPIIYSLVNPSDYEISYDEEENYLLIPNALLKELLRIQYNTRNRTLGTASGEFNSPYSSHILYHIFSFFLTYLIPKIGANIGPVGMHRFSKLPRTPVFSKKTLTLVPAVSYGLALWLVGITYKILSYALEKTIKSQNALSQNKISQFLTENKFYYDFGASNIYALIHLALSAAMLYLLYMLLGIDKIFGEDDDEDERERDLNISLREFNELYARDQVMRNIHDKFSYLAKELIEQREDELVHYNTALIAAYDLYYSIVNSSIYEGFKKDFGVLVAYYKDLYRKDYNNFAPGLLKYFDYNGNISLMRISSEVFEIYNKHRPALHEKDREFNLDGFKKDVELLQQKIISDMLVFAKPKMKEGLSDRYNYYSDIYIDINNIIRLKYYFKELSAKVLTDATYQYNTAAHVISEFDFYKNVLSQAGLPMFMFAENLNKSIFDNQPRKLEGLTSLEEKGVPHSENFFKKILYRKIPFYYPKEGYVEEYKRLKKIK